MGYRYSLYRVSKNDINTIKDISLSALELRAYNLGISSKSIYQILHNTINLDFIYELGELWRDSTEVRIQRKGYPLFKDSDVQKIFYEADPYVIGKEGLLEAINIWQEKTVAFYKDLLADDTLFDTPLPRTSSEKINYHVHDLESYHSYNLAVNTDENNKWIISDAWTREYSIYNLIHILKTVDWEKDTIVMMGG